MSLDHIVEIEVVLANSSIVRVSADAYSDIFWALRGAAAGFGVITEFVCRTEPAPGTAVQYSYSYTFGDVETRAALFEKWQDYVTQPDLTWKLASTLTIYPSYIEISGTFFGTEAEYEALNIQNTFPGSSNASQIVFDNFLGLVGYWAEEVELQLVGGLPAHFYAKSRSFTAQSLMTSAQIRNMFTYLDNADAGTDIWFAIFDLQAGATNTVPVSATAYDARDTIFWLQSYAVNLAGDISNTTYTFLDQLNQITAAGDASPANYRAYPGYVDPRLANPQEAYWGVNLPRLEAIKAAVDPNNVFSNPQSVRPAAS